MNTVKVLLIDSTDAVKALFEKQMSHSDELKFDVTRVTPKLAEDNVAAGKNGWDVILFGEKMPQANVTSLTKMYRSKGYSTPIFLLTKQSEAHVPLKLQKNGIDDMLNVAEINTPLFSWTFMSTIKQTEARKKAVEFDAIRERLHTVDETIAVISHEINNPLGIIKLVLYHLNNPDIPKEKKESYMKMLVENIEKIDTQMNELREVRRQLGEDTYMLTKIFSEKEESKKKK